MKRFDAPFTAFRVWWREASNGPRSRAIAAATGTFAFLVWIAVPSGGGLLNNVAAGFPTSATGQSGNTTAPPGGQGAQLASDASMLATPSSDSAGAAGLAPDNSLSSPSGDSGTGAGASPDSASAPSGPGPIAAPGPTTPSSTCPVSFPSTSTPADGLAAQLTALCGQLLAGGSGPVPAGSVPGGGSAGQAGAGPAQVPRQWMYLDVPVAASGAPNASWGPVLSAEMGGRSPTVPVGLVQGTPVPPSLAGTVGDLVQRGVLLQLVLVPQLTAPGGAPAFASWVAQVLSVLKPVQLVAIGTGGPTRGSSAATVASYTVAGLTAARQAPSPPTAGVMWLDGGTESADAPVWSSLESAGAWSQTSFVARALDAAGACPSPAAFAATLRRHPAAAGLPVMSEAVQAPAPASWVAADGSCLRGSVAQGPAASVAMWRLWEGPVSK
jgi:hypothetical protein